MRVKLVLLSYPDEVGQDLFLSRVLSLMGTRGQLLHLSLVQPIYAHSPIAVLREAVAIKRRQDITATSRVFVVVPCSPQTSTLLQDDEVTAVVALDQVDGGTHASNAGADDDNSCVGMVLVAYGLPLSQRWSCSRSPWLATVPLQAREDRLPCCIADCLLKYDLCGAA